MIDLTSASQIAITGLSGAIGVVGTGFWVKKWIDRTDVRLDSIQEKLTEIQIENAQIKEKVTNKELCYEQLRKEVSALSINTNKTLVNFNTLLKQSVGKETNR